MRREITIDKLSWWTGIAKHGNPSAYEGADFSAGGSDLNPSVIGLDKHFTSFFLT